MIVRIFISNETLNKYWKLRNQYVIDKKGMKLESFYIVNYLPKIFDMPNLKSKFIHNELIFEVTNLNHLHLTFYESK